MTTGSERITITGLDAVLGGDPATMHTINVPACDPETIVRALAALDPRANLTGDLDCPFCCAYIGDPRDDDWITHEPDCPWRLAVEWVAGH